MATYPEDGAGLSCTPDSPADCGVPLYADLELRFDRFLLPSTVVRQSVVVSSGNAGVFLQPRYDVIERVVVLSLGGGGTWQPGTRYTVKLLRANEHADGWGFAAFDGAPLDADGPVPLEFTFRTRRTFEPRPAPPPTPTWPEIRDVLDRGSCASTNCHRGPQASMGLDLSHPPGIEATAINEVAHETDSELSAAEAWEETSRFGLQMPVIDRGRPSNSYLLYKTLIDPRAYRSTCETSYQVALQGCVRFPREAADELRAWFVRGDPMPLDPGRPLSLDDLRLLDRWIASGAPLPLE